MRSSRLKIDSAQAAMVYHANAHLVTGTPRLDQVELSFLHGLVGRVAAFCGVRILTYALMGSHMHLLIHVPQAIPISNEELLRRDRILHPPRSGKRYWGGTCTLEELERGDPHALEWRQRKLRQMGDLSPFMQLVLGIFAQWYNHRHQREGPLWRGRFHSTMNQPAPVVMRAVAAYIDSNPVGAGLVQDPLDYPHCGYAEAVAGGADAREGLRQVLGGEPGRSWPDLQAEYRLLLFVKGLTPRADKVPIDPERFRQVMREGGHLSLSQILGCRVRHLTNGAVLGTEEWVREHVDLYMTKTRCRRRPKPRPLPVNLGLGGLCLLRRFRGEGVEPVG